MSRTSEKMMGGIRIRQEGDDRHQIALYRLAAIDQYLYDVMNGDRESSREEPDPLPLMSMECVRDVQDLIQKAIKNGQRTRRRCLGGEMKLSEDWQDDRQM